jgi:hypothetical protein
VSDDKDHTVTDQLLCGRDRLFGIAEVVRRDQLHLLAKHAAGGVDVGHRLRRAALHLLTEPGILAGQRARHADQYARPSGPAERDGKRDHDHGEQATHQHSPRFG